MTAATELPLTIGLAPPLLDLSADGVARHVEAELLDLLRTFGVNLLPTVRLEPTAPADGPAITLAGTGQRWAFPDTALYEALAYVEGTYLVSADLDAATLAARLGGTGDAAERLGELLALLCRDQLAGRLADLVPDGPTALALSLGLSLAERSPAFDNDSSEPAERTIGEWAAPTIDVHIDPGLARALTLESDAAERFLALRDAFATELGLVLPPFRLRLDTTLKPGGHAFRIQGMRTMPRIGLEPGTILVDQTPSFLSLWSVDAQDTVDPLTGRPAAITSEVLRPLLADAGFGIWSPLGHFILSFTAVLQRSAHRLMTEPVANRMVDELVRAFPHFQAGFDLMTSGSVTPVLRELLLDGVSIRNLRLIMELLLRFETSGEAGPNGDPVAFVRRGLADQISHQASQGGASISAYLLDPDLEDALADEQRAAGPDAPRSGRERPCHGLESRLAYALAPARADPCVVTRDELRRPVREALRHRFPMVTVLGHGDLTARSVVEPIAHIG